MGWIADLLKEIPSAARYKAELEEMEGENTKLKQKVLSLQSENDNLRQEIQRRDDIIQKKKSHSNLLDDIKVKILLLLAKQADKFTADQIARALSADVQIVTFHLQELTNQRMAQDMIAGGAPRRWYLAHEGRRYLIEHKLIS
jgi:predicted nuclease with TOPRIM domain